MSLSYIINNIYSALAARSENAEVTFKLRFTRARAQHGNATRREFEFKTFLYANTLQTPPDGDRSSRTPLHTRVTTTRTQRRKRE